MVSYETIIERPLMHFVTRFGKEKRSMKKAIGILVLLSGAALLAAGILTLAQRPRARRRSITRHF